MKGDMYKDLLSKRFDEEIIQTINIKYGTDKSNIGKFWTYLKIKFDANDLPSQPQSGQFLGIWDILDSGFK